MTDPAGARGVAARLADALAERDPQLVAFEGADLRGSLEQQLFFAIRDGSVPQGGWRSLAGRARGLGAPVAAAIAGTLARTVSPGPGPMVVLVRDPTHYVVVAQIEAELRRQAGEALAIVRVGRAASVSPAHAVAPRLQDLFQPRRSMALLAFQGRLGRRLATASTGWDEIVGSGVADRLRSVASRELGLVALGAAGLASAVDRWKPSLLVAFDEVGTWARLLPAVARGSGIPSLDLPHAEAADPAAIVGAGYDRMAVYGPRAAATLRAAGIAPDRISEIGAPRFDPLVRSSAERRAASSRTVIFAAQYVSGAMRADVHASCYRAAVAAATACDAAKLVVMPHPAEQPGTAAELIRDNLAPEGLEVQLAPPGSLHQALPDAWLLVTGWSNSVFEAAIAGVPALAVNPGGVSPVDFAADGLALAASDERSAAEAAAILLDDAVRQAAMDRARASLAERLGPLDGRASERAAGLMLMLASGGPPA